ncbi:trypsin-like peptidase domain-containing protein [Streptomyces sp. NPDC093516]|uniref:effector-associated domain 2-containing protein n=1 Tax=Streptomyces sp. NPDC093516 TaxID=3155304 RepID=UPI0034268CE9
MVRTGSGGTRQDSRAATEAPWRLRVLVRTDEAGTADDVTGRPEAGRRRTRVAGAAVLLSGGLAVTCAHVVEAALRRPRLEEAPEDTVQVDFPAVPGAGPVAARVAGEGWFRRAPASDLAVLRLTGPPPPGTAAAPVDATAPGADVPVLVFGHPSDAPDGVWARARTVAAGGPQARWLQLDGDDGLGARIEQGFSGAGVWDRRNHTVAGVVSSVLNRAAPIPTRVAWMIPFALLSATRFAPDLGGSGEPLGAAGPADPWDVVDALLATGAVTPDGGSGLLSLLPGHIAGGVPRADRPRLQVFHLVRRCGDFGDGPGELVRAVRELEGDSISVRHFVDAAKRLWPDRLGGIDGGPGHHG